MWARCCFDGEIASSVDIADILFVNNDTGEMQYDTNGEIFRTIVVTFLLSSEGQCETDISKHKLDKSHGKMKDLDSGSRRSNYNSGHSEDFSHSAPSSPRADSIQDEATSASDQSTANASPSDEDFTSSSKEFFNASRKRQLKDSSQYNNKKVNRRKGARKLSGKSSSKNVTKQTMGKHSGDLQTTPAYYLRGKLIHRNLLTSRPSMIDKSYFIYKNFLKNPNDGVFDDKVPNYMLECYRFRYLIQ
ncbi:hypothetical protein BC829DRAFT_424155 [Chytridium lagenaria]|nr:hypothetical protein BC829DRAFT_424155 [Chytridium lagenaria]